MAFAATGSPPGGRYISLGPLMDYVFFIISWEGIIMQVPSYHYPPLESLINDALYLDPRRSSPDRLSWAPILLPW